MYPILAVPRVATTRSVHANRNAAPGRFAGTGLLGLALATFLANRRAELRADRDQFDQLGSANRPRCRDDVASSGPALHRCRPGAAACPADGDSARSQGREHGRSLCTGSSGRSARTICSRSGSERDLRRLREAELDPVANMGLIVTGGRIRPGQSDRPDRSDRRDGCDGSRDAGGLRGSQSPAEGSSQAPGGGRKAAKEAWTPRPNVRRAVRIERQWHKNTLRPRTIHGLNKLCLVQSPSRSDSFGGRVTLTRSV